MTMVLYALIYTRVLPTYRKSPYASSQVFINQSILFAMWHVMPKSSIKDLLSRYLEFLVIKVKVIITRLITLISLLYSHSDVGLIVGVADYNFFIIGIFNYSLFTS